MILANYINGTTKAWDVARALTAREATQHDIYIRAAAIRKRLGIKMVPRVTEPRVTDWELVGALLDEHMTAHEIAEMFGVTVDYIRTEMRKCGRIFHTRNWMRARRAA